MFFRGNSEQEQAYDCCIHGNVIFKIGDTLLSDNSEWCVNASAYRFLHTLFQNHFSGSDNFLIPCCGHTMIASKDKNTVDIIGCDNGIDFDIIHESENVIIRTSNNIEYTVPFTDYKVAVLTFAKQVEQFYKSNPPRKFHDDFDKNGYSAFINEWYSLYDKAVILKDDIPKIKSITFEDYDCYTENEILNINEHGISLKNFVFINFKECAYIFNQVEGGSKKCIGEREISDLSFTFYTSPKPIMIKFIPKNKFVEHFSKNNTISRFYEVQHQIIKYGYTTQDMS